MNLTELRTIPYWEDEDGNEMPDTIPAPTTVGAPAAGLYLLNDEGRFDFSTHCFAERL